MIECYYFTAVQWWHIVMVYSITVYMWLDHLAPYHCIYTLDHFINDTLITEMQWVVSSNIVMVYYWYKIVYSNNIMVLLLWRIAFTSTDKLYIYDACDLYVQEGWMAGTFLVIGSAAQCTGSGDGKSLSWTITFIHTKYMILVYVHTCVGWMVRVVLVSAVREKRREVTTLFLSNYRPSFRS